MAKKSLIIFFILICTIFAFNVNADIQDGDIVLGITPEYPKINEDVTASVTTYATDLNNARITWILNGDVVLVGVGKKSFSFKVGDSDSQTTLEVKIETTDGATLSKKTTLSPSGVDMLWEAYNAYVPPFYKGKTLASIEGSVKVVAIPSNQNPAGLNYQWKKDDKVQQDSSGYQQNYYIYKNSFLEDENNIAVTISDILGNNIGANNISITPGNPKILFYRRDPALGTRWENIIADNFGINTNGETIVAEPYFFSNNDLSSTGYDINWFLNGEKTQTPNDQRNTLSIKPESGTSGTTSIKVNINNNKTLFQSVEKQINVNF